ncbi:MAG: ergothioneine biosynthesis protein EgtB [Balneolaceae bacterium]|nr:ergothioneine biosynthesis protein EgtB [Balneolaceae bacterium]
MATETIRKDTTDKLKPRFQKENLIKTFKTIRNFSDTLVAPLETEDFVIQAMENTSPTKWHLAHTSWFFETFILEKAIRDYESMHPQYAYLFNSYYLQTGEPYKRADRGLISRPTVSEVFDYREYIDEQVIDFLDRADQDRLSEWGPVIEIGIHHEQQHQELILTDLKYMFYQNPLNPAYRDLQLPESKTPDELRWISFEEGIYHVGNDGGEFTYDNEHPRHRRFLEPFSVTDRLITNAKFLEFIEDDGYHRSPLWLDDGWATVNERGWEAPLYWEKRDDEWYQFTLSGLRKLEPNEPVSHISYYEADAFARWAGARLPTEGEWEAVAGDLPYEGNFVDEGHYHPKPLQNSENEGFKQVYGDVWEWTQSGYDPYPGYKPLEGALGEYNGKFMCGQYVLRGGSCATSQSHIRKTYRNFFYPDARWQFSGLRLARSLHGDS